MLDLLPSWQLALVSANKSKGTVETYTRGVRSFQKWCQDTGTTPTLDKPTVTRFVADMLASGAEPTTAKARQHALKMFSKWLADEGEIDENFIKDLPPPKLNTKVTEALTDDQVRAMIRACQGKAFVDRRDEALVRLLVETGVRAGEALALDTADVNLAAMTAVIRKGKGGKGRVVPFSSQCAAAIDRYLRMRRRQGVPDDGPLWVGARGTTFAYYGMRLTLGKRAKAAGINNFHLHLLRHTAATRWLRAGGSEAGLMAVAGWSDRAMLDRYTSASASERSIAEARKLGLGDL
ncbi:tyrosine-type recombinase/integrase [Mycolicibacterium pulveris]|uniref:tyrosine-type recombinase/integrase n=1 Tax=Mycolicibacterium pulveris TaxID=36813 RepID=UPI0021F3A21C|nr:tyrosine-type recombinase/integrase [Mycolicibacterium pulveris]